MVSALFFPLANRASAQRSVRTFERTVTKIADGVYVIIHKDASDDWPQGNTVVIIGDRGVFVVDACLLTESAKEDIAEIRRLTPKPVRYLLNTHWHIDHNGGNSAYTDAFPGIEIIAHTETRTIMNAVNPGVARGWPTPDGPLAKEIAGLKKSLETGNAADGKPLSATDQGKLRQADRADRCYVCPTQVPPQNRPYEPASPRMSSMSRSVFPKSASYDQMNYFRECAVIRAQLSR